MDFKIVTQKKTILLGRCPHEKCYALRVYQARCRQDSQRKKPTCYIIPITIYDMSYIYCNKYEIINHLPQ